LNNKEAIRAKKERTAFALFANALSKWAVVKDVRSQPQGYADIAADFKDELVGFELIGIVDEDLKAQKGLSNWANVDKKLYAKLTSKNYMDQGPIELLIYSEATFLTTDMILDESQKTLWKDELGPFRRVWFLTEDNRVFLFHKSWWSEIGLVP
jgi:hypothetical protein